ncbi:hypothetical protein PM082_006330 [Marasmius tenuissimus]|nr:hypothetical protein PM082_006330 [Marasmius tenuissimus]
MTWRRLTFNWVPSCTKTSLYYHVEIRELVPVFVAGLHFTSTDQMMAYQSGVLQGATAQRSRLFITLIALLALSDDTLSQHPEFGGSSSVQNIEEAIEPTVGSGLVAEK